MNEREPQNANSRRALLTRLFAWLIIGCQVAQPVHALHTNISTTPLSSGTISVLPNLMFLFDDSGTMAYEYLPDYVEGGVGGVYANSKLPTSSSGGTGPSLTNQQCQPGDPCWYAGGVTGFNGVYYDPTVNYKAGVTYSGANIITTINVAAMTSNAYLFPTATTTNLTATSNTNISTDKRYCTSAAATLCKRNGASHANTPVINAASTSGDLDSRSDSGTYNLAAGQFPYREHRSNCSTCSFGLPEVLPIAVFSRSGTTVTVTTATAHNLVAGDRVHVASTGDSNFDTSSTTVARTVVTASGTTFTFTSGSGTIAAKTGSYRKFVQGASVTASRSSTLVTVNSTAHGLQNGDRILTTAHSTSSVNASSAVTVSGVATNSFQYTSGTSGTVAASTISWVRNTLYNIEGTINTSSPNAVPPITYRITPVEYCDSAELSNCVMATTPGTAPSSPYVFPAYVRFCKTAADAYAPGAVSGSSAPVGGTTPVTSRCISKFIQTAPTNGSAYYFVRYGQFTREHIVNSGSYSNRTGRSDCSGAPTCTFTEEMQNFARWYMYYRERYGSLKAAVGRSLQQFVSNPSATPSVPSKIRVGMLTLNPCGDSDPSLGCTVETTKRYLKIDDFAGGGAASHAANFYSRFYNLGSATVPTVGYTPMALALSRIGWIYAGKVGVSGTVTAGIPTADDPVQASCQRNFALLVTDGFWNNLRARKLDNSIMDNQDNVDGETQTGYTDATVSRATGTFDGVASGGATPNCNDAATSCSTAGTVGTVADVAMYYYKTDLRGNTSSTTASSNPGPKNNAAGVDVSSNNVPTKPGNKDFATHQHMVTFAIGMSDGLMRYQSDYETSSTGDFANIKAGNSNCSWSPGALCNWPQAQGNTQSALDDVWHAAVNGRGTYYSARDAASITTGLENALNALNAQVAAAAASATSSPNITQFDRQIFSTTYETDTWSGKIVAQNINATTGEVESAILWTADTLLLSKVSASSDSRTIKYFSTSSGNLNKLKDFTFTNVSADGLSTFFASKCPGASSTALGQCALGTINLAQYADLNDGTNMVNYLRGHTGLELTATLSSGSFRNRRFLDPATNAESQTVLGDTINARPAYVRAPLFNYADNVGTGETYAQFKSDKSTRSPRLYIGANDGYLHAFNGDTGEEAWAYLPRFLMSGLYVLADKDYKNRHTYFVDGSPESADIYDATEAKWKTILVGGTNAGARGFYALDITDPTTPKGLWEFCNTSVCATNDVNLGLSFGNPIIGKRASDGKWVVVLTSGLNNANSDGTSGNGDGRGYFYVLDALTGAMLGTPIPVTAVAGVGSTTTPSGLMKQAALFEAATTDATFQYIWAGDQLGNLWRLDLGSTSGATPSVTHLARLMDSSTTPKAQPITTKPALTKINTGGGGYKTVLFVGTGRYIGKYDLDTVYGSSGGTSDTTVAYTQSFYAFKDKTTSYHGGAGPAATSGLRAVASLVTQTLSEPTSTTRTTSNTTVDWATNDGWKIDFNLSTGVGERVNIDPDLVLGTVVVTTNVPTQGTGSTQCSVGGDSWQYQLDYKSGAYLSTSANNVAGQRLGSVVTVGVAVVQLPSGAIKGIVTSADTSKSTIGVQLSSGAAAVRRFSYRER